MKKILMILCAAIMVVGFSGGAYAFFLDFENGTDRQEVTDITGVSFTNYNGFPAIYGDSSLGGYNTHSDDLNYGSGIYHHNGDFFLWAGENPSAQGVIVDFTNNDGTWFRTGYSAYSAFYIDAHLTDGTVVSVSGPQNTGGGMDFLTLYASAGKYIDYLVLHDTGDYWLVDDMSGDASGVSAVPEPATMLLLASGLVGLAGFRKRFMK